MPRRSDTTSPTWAKLGSLAMGVLLTTLLVCAAEAGARWWVEETDLDRILAMLEQDPVLFWRNRANRDTVFFHAPVATDGRGIRRPGPRAAIGPKRPGVPRIVCMGESPTFGWGVPYEAAYPARLEALLRAGTGREIEVINAGMIGHSSHQGRLLFEREILDLKPDLITIPYVINDVDRYRFFRSDGETDRSLAPLGEWTTAIGNKLGRSRFLAWVSRRVRDAVGGASYFEGRPIGMLRPSAVRVPPDDYRENLEGIVRTARDHGVAVLLLAMPVNLPTGDPVPEPAAREAAVLVERAERLILRENGCDAAMPMLERAYRTDPNSGDADYYRGVCMLRREDRTAAAAAFERAMIGESRRCGSRGAEYNRLMADVATALDVPWVDLVTALDRIGREGLFLTDRNDPIHPNESGHEAIARSIFEELVRLDLRHFNLPEPKRFRPPAVPLEP